MGQLTRNEVFTLAVQKYSDAVYRAAIHNSRCTADAEDVVQDVYEKLLHYNGTFESEEHLKAWLLRVTLHCCIDLRRSAWWKRTAPLEAAADAAAPLGEEKGALWQAVEALPTDLRTAVWLHYVEGYGTDEIAEIVSCRPATVRTRLHRARKKLQTELKGELNDEHVGRNEEYQGAGRAEGADSRGGA